MRGGYAELYASALGGLIPYANLAIPGTPFIPVGPDSTVEAVLRKILSYYPEARDISEVLNEVEELYAEQ